MKKLLSALTLLLISQYSLANIHILTCEPEWAALAFELTGNNADIVSATTANQDPHTIQARPSLIAKARDADLLICSGAELEVGWLPILLQKSANPKIQVNTTGYFMATHFVSLLDKGQRADRSGGDIHLEGNPHIHPNPYNLLKVADGLLPVLIQLMPEKKDELIKNHQQFTNNMQAAIQKWQPLLQTLHNMPIVVHHDNWIYMNQWLGLTKVATLEPKPGVPPTTSHLIELLSTLKQTPAKLIIYTGYQDSKPSLWLSEKTGIKAVMLPASVDDWKQQGALIKWLDSLVNLITENSK